MADWLQGVIALQFQKEVDLIFGDIDRLKAAVYAEVDNINAGLAQAGVRFADVVAA